MGFHLAQLNSTELDDYIGSNTIHSCADSGAFDFPVSTETEQFVEETQGMGAVEGEDIEQCIGIIKNGSCHGRDINKLIELLETKYSGGFILYY